MGATRQALAAGVDSGCRSAYDSQYTEACRDIVPRIRWENSADMWLAEHSVGTSASTEAIWRLLSDIDAWSRWDASIGHIEADGPLMVGTVLTLTEPGQEPVSMRVSELKPGELLVTEADLGDAIVRTVRRIATWAGSTRVFFRLEVTGPAADEVGPKLGSTLSEHFPDALAALARLAEG